VRFVETPIFTEEITDLLSDDQYRDLQLALVLRPEQGALIRGSGGLRKLRWRVPGSGKRGGARVIYYRLGSDEAFYMLRVYRKSEQEDLTPAQVRILSRLVREEFR
jgi:hypothetical protein